MLLLLVALFLTGPAFSQVPNSSCYVVGPEMQQYRPCKPAEVR